MTNIRRMAIPLLAVALCGTACFEELDPFEDLADMRVLGIVGDGPSIVPDGETTLSAIVFADGDRMVSYSWDWCPFSTGASSEYACAFTQEEVDELVAELPFPTESPSLKLGDTPEVTFRYPLPAPVLEGFCAATQTEEITDFVTLPDCKTSFPVTVRLIATTDAGDRIVAVKTINLLYEEPEPASELNQNPQISGLRVRLKGEPEESTIALEDGFEMDRDQTYRLFVDVDEDQSQTYTGDDGEIRENLIVHWFYEHGSMREEQTGFVDGFTSFDDLAENSFFTPEDPVDGGEIELVFVIRDERGGIGFDRRVVTLK